MSPEVVKTQCRILNNLHANDGLGSFMHSSLFYEASLNFCAMFVDKASSPVLQTRYNVTYKA